MANEEAHELMRSAWATRRPSFDVAPAERLELLTQAKEALTCVAAMPEVIAAVDEPNTTSIRVPERVGFARIGSAPGAFGRTLLYRLSL